MHNIKRVKLLLNSFLGVFALSLLVGCASTPERYQEKFISYGRDDLSGRQVACPPNYNIENFSKLPIAVDFGPKLGDQIPDELAPYINNRMQSEIAKLKRFSVIAVHGKKDNRAKSLEDVDELKLAARENPTIKYFLHGTLEASRETQLAGRKQEFTFRIHMILTLEDLKTGKAVFSITKDLAPVKRSQVLSSTGRIMPGGFANDLASIKAAMDEPVTEAMIVIANNLGNCFPVGGKIESLRDEDTIRLDRGADEGIGGKMQMTIFVSEDEDDIPLAFAEATPAKTGKSMLKIWKWNNTPIAKRYRKQIEKMIENGENFAKNHSVYAVGFGMAKPAEWENDYFDKRTRNQ